MIRKDDDEDCPEWELMDKKRDNCLDELVEMELLKNDVIILHGELNEENSDRVSKRLLYLKYKGSKKIKIILNSVGGEIYHGLLIYDTLQDLTKAKIKVTIEARGLCASMAVTILQGASEGQRFATAQTRFLLHEVSSFTYGKSSEIKDESIELEKLNTMLDDILIKRSTLTKEEICKNARRKDWWLSAEEALQHKVIDKVI